MVNSYVDYAAARKVTTPFAAADPALLLDIDFRLGQTAAEAIMTAGGLTANGTGGWWNTEKGWNPNGEQGYSSTAWMPNGYVSRATAFASHEYTIYMEVERSALACAWVDNSASLIDSEIGPSMACWNGSTITPANHPYGDYTAGTVYGHVFYVGTTSGTYPNTVLRYQCANTAGNPTGRVVFSTGDTSATNLTMRPVADVPKTFDPDFVRVTITCVDRVQRLYFDGHLVYVKNLTTDFWTADLFIGLFIGSNKGAANRFRGYIRRFQIANKAANNLMMEGPRIAFIGDSFTRAGADTATPASSTVAASDAVQNGLSFAPLLSSTDHFKTTVVGQMWRPWVHELVRMAANEHLPFAFYGAGNSGRGWAATGPTVPEDQFEQFIFDAVVQYDPEIIVGAASINDVTNFGPAPYYLEEVQERITNLVSRSPSCRKFLFVECWPVWKGDNGKNTTAWKSEYHRQRVLQKSLDGYTVNNKSGIPVVVEFVPVYEWIGGDNYNERLNLGSGQVAVNWDALYGGATAGSDPHPGQWGWNRIAERLWEVLKPLLTRPPT